MLLIVYFFLLLLLPLVGSLLFIVNFLSFSLDYLFILFIYLFLSFLIFSKRFKLIYAIDYTLPTAYMLSLVRWLSHQHHFDKKLIASTHMSFVTLFQFFFFFSNLIGFIITSTSFWLKKNLSHQPTFPLLLYIEFMVTKMFVTKVFNIICNY